MELKTTLLYNDTVGALCEQLSDEQLGRFLRLCIRYTSDGTADELAGIIAGDAALAVAWAMYRPLIDRDAEKYRAKCEKLRENVRKRWERTEQMQANASKCKQTDTNVYKCIQIDSNNNNNNINNNNNECVNTPRTRTREQWCELFTGEQYTGYREALAMTWRNLSPAQVLECIRRAVEWCESAGKSLDEPTLKRYINKECELASQRPAGTIEQRRDAFHNECRGLLKICDDKALVSQFFAEYSQPCNGENAGLMLFESMRAWDTVTRFKLYIKNHG